MQPHTEPVCRFLCRAKIKKKAASSLQSTRGSKKERTRVEKQLLYFDHFF